MAFSIKKYFCISNLLIITKFTFILQRNFLFFFNIENHIYSPPHFLNQNDRRERKRKVQGRRPD